jgi:FlaG/FlaF family flagellin (archaellin)
MKKTLILSVIAVMMMSPLSMFANDFDGFFRGVGNDVYTNRDVDTQGITIEGMHSESPVEAPLGSGLLVMVAAGIGYAAMRRFRKVKSNSLIAMLIAVVLLFGMTQCRKKVVELAKPGTVFMTVTAGGGDRVVFNPSILGFNWNITGNEYVVVSGNYSGYLGELTALSCGGCAVTQRKEFSGMITAPNDKDTELYFFYLGNGSHSQEPGTESVVIDFSNQVDEDVSTVTDYLIATEHISANDVVIENEQCHVRIDLRVKTAIAYFKLSGFVSTATIDEEVFLHGSDLYSSAEINFKTGEVIGKDKGFINVGTNNENGFYVSLIGSGTTGATTLYFDSNSKSGSIVFPDGIKENVFYSDELNSEFTPLSIEAAMSLPDDVLPGLFSVSPTKKVRFSKGNLKFSRASLNDDWSTGTWSFMENQYGYVEPNNWIGYQFVPENAIDEDYANKTEVGLFGWGCTGSQDVEHGETQEYYMPNSTSYGGEYSVTALTANAAKYGPTGSFNLSVINHSDWGYCVNHDESSSWRVLTISEWWYMLGMSTDCRGASTVSGVDNARFTRAKVNDTYGLVILPDEYEHPDDVAELTAGFVNHQGGNESFSDSNVDVISVQDWAKIEAAGAVFLPVAGMRDEGDVFSVQDGGYYWSCTNVGASSAYMFNFDAGFMTKMPQMRYEGFSVRLVYDHQ